MVFVVSQKQGPHGLLLVITDKEIMGKVFEEGKVQLDLSKEFYKGVDMEREDTKKLLTKARTLHFTGKEAVALGVEQNLIDSNKILWVQDTPHAEVVWGE